MYDELEPANIEIEVPDSPRQSPRVNDENLTVRPGQRVCWRSNRPVKVVFGAQTPFVRGNGQQAVKEFNVRATNSLRIRNDDEDLPDQTRYKYTVMDPGEAERPPLDPYIIVRR